jgi:hypothetical protein
VTGWVERDADTIDLNGITVSNRYDGGGFTEPGAKDSQSSTADEILDTALAEVVSVGVCDYSAVNGLPGIDEEIAAPTV